jgi:hypothetical protein
MIGGLATSVVVIFSSVSILRVFITYLHTSDSFSHHLKYVFSIHLYINLTHLKYIFPFGGVSFHLLYIQLYNLCNRFRSPNLV